MCSNANGYACKKPREGEWTTEKTTHYPAGEHKNVNTLNHF